MRLVSERRLCDLRLMVQVLLPPVSIRALRESGRHTLDGWPRTTEARTPLGLGVKIRRASLRDLEMGFPGLGPFPDLQRLRKHEHQ